MPSQKGLSRRAQLAGGQPISELMSRALAQPELISLAAGFVDQETLPAESVAQALQQLLADPARARAAMQYGTTPGYPPLRELVLDRFRTADGNPANEQSLTIDQVVITSGSNQLLHLLLETLFDPQDIILCPAPTYFVFLGLLQNLDIRAIGVAADAQGVIPSALDEELSRRDKAGELDRVKAIYVCSYFDNPTTTTVPADRRQEIVRIAKRWSTQQTIRVIEDAAYREMRYEGQDVPSMRAFDDEGETVIVTGTFSKSFSPGIRVGWGILPPDLVEPVTNQKGNIDFGSPNFNQHLLATVLEQGLHEPHVQRLRDNYRVKLEAMHTAAGQHLGKIPGVHWMLPQGGLYIWLRLPESIPTGSSGTLIDRAMDEGMLYVPGEYFYPPEGEAIQKNMIRLSFGIQSVEKITQGVEALARAIKAVS